LKPPVSVIDFRARANTPEAARYTGPRLSDIATLGIRNVDGAQRWHEAPIETVAGFVERLDQAGIGTVVFTGRNRRTQPDWPLTNEWVAAAARDHPGRIVGFAGIDAEHLDDSGRVLVHAVEVLGLRGANLDPFQIDASPDDPRFDPVYEMCTSLGIPLVVTVGAIPAIRARLRNWPLAIDAVAQRFPELTIVACHGGWPFTSDMIAVAWRNPNVYFDNSAYHLAPGAGLIVEAVNTLVMDKVVYASAYPFMPLEETLANVLNLGFSDDALRRLLHDNAARILRL
jgi:predicted TIM-barrel fold metal-dependent hydrolase